jgi:hypothetical protein
MTARLTLTCLLGFCLATSALAAPIAPTGTWRFTHALPAPWGGALAGGADLAGKSLTFGPRAMAGPAPMDCAAPARLEPTSSPAEGLFQGGLPLPAKSGAQNLGFKVFPVPGLRVTCDKGLFDFHQADAHTLLLGLDNRVWSLSRTAGTRADAASPAGQVQTLLEQHFGGDMGFQAPTAEAKAPFQSKALNKRVATYLAKPRPQDEVPPINGDPYTDSQEYPTRFAVGAAQVQKNRARVPVQFSDAWRQRTLTFELVREEGAWRLDDVDYGQGGRFSALLQE